MTFDIYRSMLLEVSIVSIIVPCCLLKSIDLLYHGVGGSIISMDINALVAPLLIEIYYDLSLCKNIIFCVFKAHCHAKDERVAALAAVLQFL